MGIYTLASDASFCRDNITHFGGKGLGFGIEGVRVEGLRVN
jgi:hypothetical protein